MKKAVSQAITISIVNNKGGVGKTITTAIMAELLAYLNYKVLLVDLDESANLSMTFHAYEEDSPELVNGVILPDRPHIHELLKYRYYTKEDVETVIHPTNVENVDIIPSSKRHKNSSVIINMNTGNNNIVLKKGLAAIRNEYDFILIDNAPADNILTVNTMFASDYVLVPMRVEEFSFKGLKETLSSIYYIKEEHDLAGLHFLGTFLTQAERNTRVFRQVTGKCADELMGKFFETAIRKDVSIPEVQNKFIPILEYNPNTNAVFDYARLLMETGLLDEEAWMMLEESIRQVSEEIVNG